MAANPRRIIKLTTVLHLPQVFLTIIVRSWKRWLWVIPVKQSHISDVQLPVIFHMIL